MQDPTPAPLAPEPLEASSFAPFGQVLAFDPANAYAVNDGQALRSDLPARFEPAGNGGAPTLAMFRARRQSLPAAIRFVERHPHSSQAFLPLAPRGFQLVVAPDSANGEPDLARARAFFGRPGQGVNYRRGVWHAPIAATDDDTDFLMLIWERGLADDTVVHRLARPLIVRARPTHGAPFEEVPHGA